MSETANNMRYMLCCGQNASRFGCGCCSLQTSTICISVIEFLSCIPIMLGMLSLKWKIYDALPISFCIFMGVGMLAPILMFVGSLKMDFGISHVGYVFHCIYLYCLIFFALFIGIFFGVKVLPTAYMKPPYELYYIGYFIFWLMYIGFLLYFNHVYYSFTKFLGMGQPILCYQVYSEEMPQLQLQQPVIKGRVLT